MSIRSSLETVSTMSWSGRLGECDVLIAGIGKSWLTDATVSGRPLLDDPLDYVRLEIETALYRRMRVIPVLVDGAHMPSASDLPLVLKPLSQRQGLSITHSNFRSDVSSCCLRLKVPSPEPEDTFNRELTRR